MSDPLLIRDLNDWCQRQTDLCNAVLDSEGTEGEFSISEAHGGLRVLRDLASWLRYKDPRGVLTNGERE
ncbi:MAG: hypothetical protein HYV27_15140 [Candidatus Hydrogenedentes bacterium]|nr:hypothetical protein [Candidatus Hydrogenedentota bacterium]